MKARLPQSCMTTCTPSPRATSRAFQCWEARDYDTIFKLMRMPGLTSDMTTHLRAQLPVDRRPEFDGLLPRGCARAVVLCGRLAPPEGAPTRCVAVTRF